MWFKTEFRFVQIFKKYKLSDEHLSLMHQMNNLVENNNSRLYDINIIKILTQEDTRTMLMVKNIPNKFTKDRFLNIFNQHFECKFNLFLLSTDINEKKNYEYAFINFILHYYIIKFYAVKIYNIIYSKIQNVSEMIKYYPIKVMYVYKR